MGRLSGLKAGSASVLSVWHRLSSRRPTSDATSVPDVTGYGPILDQDATASPGAGLEGRPSSLRFSEPDHGQTARAAANHSQTAEAVWPDPVGRRVTRVDCHGNYAGLVTVPTLEELHARGPLQQPAWPDVTALGDAVRELRAKPPLVFAGECDDLKANLAKVAAGRAFLLQGGDCAETFESVTAENVRAKLQVLLQMAVVLTYGASVPVVKLGRIAGQYAKPRSSDSEVREGVGLPAYRGDAVNGFEFSATSRRPDPARLVQVYNSSAATLNLCRAFLQGGFADLRQMHAWNTDFVRTSPVGAVYERLAGDIERALDFMKAIGAESEELHRVGFHSSHEALLLEYEHALTRIDSRTELPYDVSGHFVWIGERTRQLDGAHVEYASKVRNPIGVKLGPTTTPETALELIEKLNPDNQPGRLSFITRFGAGKIRDGLPNVVEKVTAS